VVMGGLFIAAYAILRSAGGDQTRKA